jgi:hypothetical protein
MERTQGTESKGRFVQHGCALNGVGSTDVILLAALLCNATEASVVAKR